MESGPTRDILAVGLSRLRATLVLGLVRRIAKSPIVDHDLDLSVELTRACQDSQYVGGPVEVALLQVTGF